MIKRTLVQVTREEVVAIWGEDAVVQAENNVLLGINKPLVKTTYRVRWGSVVVAVCGAIGTVIWVLI